jgi:hypothetical protein
LATTDAPILVTSPQTILCRERIPHRLWLLRELRDADGDALVWGSRSQDRIVRTFEGPLQCGQTACGTCNAQNANAISKSHSSSVFLRSKSRGYRRIQPFRFCLSFPLGALPSLFSSDRKDSTDVLSSAMIVFDSLTISGTR